MEEIKAYKCDYCGKYSRSKSHISRHEKECYHNPVTKACASCGNYELKERQRPLSIGGHPLNGQLTTESYPSCKKGIEICILNETGFERELKHHCEHWEERSGYYPIND